MAHPSADDLDIWLLRVLRTLLTERSVSRTAEILGRPQPTISQALRRLRDTLGDPILVRSGNRLIPTDRGLELKVAVEKILHDISATLLPAPRRKPSTLNLHFRVISANCFSQEFLAQIIKRVRSAAPESVIDICSMPRFESVSAIIANGPTDLVIGNWPDPPEGLRRSTLFSSEAVCVMRADHPLGKSERLSLQQYLELDHLSLTPSETPGINPVDVGLLGLGIKRRIAASVCEYNSIPAVLEITNLVFTTGRHFAGELAKGRQLKLMLPPAGLPAVTFYMLWHERNHRSPAHRWFRDVMKSVADDAMGLN